MDDRIEAEKAKTLKRVLTGDIMFPENLPSGHRKRLREKFIKSGLTGFADYEVVELLLSLGTPRKDCKPLAKEAIKKFKTLRGVLSASMEELQQIKGIGPHSAFGIKLCRMLPASTYGSRLSINRSCNHPRKSSIISIIR